MILLRRAVLAAASSLAALAATAGCSIGARQGVRHILPSVTDTELYVTVSLQLSVDALSLQVDDSLVAGSRMDTDGVHWTFQIKDLKPSTTYILQLMSGPEKVGQSWPLKTFPSEAESVAALKLAAFTCAGGGDGFGFNGLEYFKPHVFRHKLLEALLELRPDAAIAIGDHIYWDLRGSEVPPLGRRKSPLIRWIIGAYLRARYGGFDRDLPLLGSVNERVLKRIANEQIADLYGIRFRSTPLFFISDDHDYFENDDAEQELVTFPADDFSRAAHQAVADLYYPPLPNTPEKGLERSFGILKYGSLFEAPLLDCAGHLSLGDDALLLPARVEEWVLNRIKDSKASTFALVPSHPMGWTAGKWREWYPDVVAPEGFEGLVTNELNFSGETQGILTTRAQKFLWQRGWWEQHQRLLAALSDRPDVRFMFSGDIHAQGAINITASDSINIDERALTSVLVGPVGTSDATWPSFARGVPASQPNAIDALITLPTSEINGFTVFNITTDGVSVNLYDCGGHASHRADDGSVLRVKALAVT